MAIAFVQGNSAAQTGTTAPSVTLGAAPTQDNLLVAAISCRNAPSSITAANGYTKVAGANGQAAYFYKVAGASEPAAQAFCTLGNAQDIVSAVVEYSGTALTSPLDLSGTTADATSPQDQAAIDPTDSIDTVMVGVATADAGGRTYSGQTIGGSAATERIDAAQGGNSSITLFDRLNVNTSTSTFAAQATVSGTPSSGTIGLLIFKALPAPQTVNPSSIASTATLGAPGPAPGAVTLSPASIAGAAALGVPSVTPGVLTLTPASIDPTASLGDPTLVNGTIAAPASIASTAAIGSPTITFGAVTISPASIASHAVVGAVSIVDASLIPGVGRLVASDAAVGALLAAVASRGSLVALESAVGRLAATVAPVAA